MIILRQKEFGDHWGARALTGSLGLGAGAVLGSKIEKRIKRSLKDKDLKNIKEK